MTLTHPPLQSGDRLTRVEFERRYEAMHDRKAELIDGVVYVASPVSRHHSIPHGLLVTWLGVYAARDPGLIVADNGTVVLDGENEVQPDACLTRRDHPMDREFLLGAPPLIVEAVYSSAAYDLHDKLEVYRRNGCREYVVVVAEPFEVFWFERTEDGAFVRVSAEAGVHRSREFPGLWLDVDALRGQDGARLLATLQKGMSDR